MPEKPTRRASSQTEKSQRPRRSVSAPDTPRQKPRPTRSGGVQARKRRKASAAASNEGTRADDLREETGANGEPPDAPDRAENEPEDRDYEEDGERDERTENDGQEGDSGPAAGVVRIVANARQQLHAVTGRPVSSVLGFQREESGWLLTVELVELERIPDTTSILGCYRVVVDDAGQLVEYRRLRRYARSQPDGD